MKKSVEYSKKIDLSKLGRSPNWRNESCRRQRQLAIESLESKSKLLNCPICSSSQLNNYLEVYQFSYLICTACKHLFCATPPSNTNLNSLYDSESVLYNDQFKLYTSENKFDQRLNDIAIPKFNYYEKFRKNGNKKIIDIGCGTGEIMMVAKSRGYEIKGFEIDKNECAFARQKGLDVQNCFFNPNQYQGDINQVEAIFMVNILEHMLDPLGYLQCIEPDGNKPYLIIEVPKHPSISSLSIEFFPDSSCRHIYPPDHLHIFSESSIDLLLRDSGFERLTTWYFGQDIYELLTTLSFNSKNHAKNSIYNDVLAKVNELQQSVDKAHLSDTMLIIAKKC